MKVIETIEELEMNLSLFENYFSEGSDEEQQFVYDLIKRGSCFVSYETQGELRFAPSRYIGYANTSMQKHNSNLDKDGKETNPAITKVLDKPLLQNSKIEEQFLNFSNNIGIKPDNKIRKYWFYKINNQDFDDNAKSEEGFPEGKIVERKHKNRERNSELTNTAKREYFEKHGHYACMVCKFDFSTIYGDRGFGFIEAHHTIPVSEMKPGDTTKVKDIALVCSNCHKMLHRYRPWLKMSELRNILKK